LIKRNFLSEPFGKGDNIAVRVSFSVEGLDVMDAVPSEIKTGKVIVIVVSLGVEVISSLPLWLKTSPDV